jgi:NADH dehydrogenase
LALTATASYPEGHPQVAQVAIQQGNYLSKYFKGKTNKAFRYQDKGSMATIGRNKAVVDLPKFKFSGFFAWIIWLFVHLAALIGARNKVIVFINWVWNYITYDQSLRLIIKADQRKGSN